mgnify:CR=1 FL=1
MNKVWMCSGSTYTQVGSGYKVSESLPVGIYSISLTMTGYHLDKYADKFVFPYKMYGLQEDFIDHVIKTYNNTEGNLGIMDYYRMKNIEADTSMRENIAKPQQGGTPPKQNK